MENRKKKDRSPEKKDLKRDKVKAIMDSKMPDEQKQEYMKQLGYVMPGKTKSKVEFAVWAKVRGIDAKFHSAMLAHPGAKGNRVAKTLTEWDQLFKGF